MISPLESPRFDVNEVLKRIDGQSTAPYFANYWQRWLARIAQIVNSLLPQQGSTTIAGSGGSSVLFTVMAGGVYIVWAQNATEGYATTAVVASGPGAAAAQISQLTQTSTNLRLSVSGLDVHGINSLGSSRLITWGFDQIF